MSKCELQSHCGRRGAREGLGCPPVGILGMAFGKKRAQPLPGARLPSVQGRRVRACASLLTAPGLAGAQPWPCPAARDQQLKCLTYLSCPGTGRGKDTPAGGDEDSGARSAARPALAQCRALSVDCTGPGSPRRLYLSVQVSSGGL